MRKAEKAWLAAAADLGCIACLLQGTPGTPAEIHHPRAGRGVSQRAEHREGIALCPAHHRGTMHPQVPSIHMAPRAFIARFGTEAELLAKTRELVGVVAA